MPSLSVVVPAGDRPPTLDRCREAIAPQLADADELIVVTACADPGPAAARNEGVGRSSGEVLLFVDADVVLAPDAIARVRAAFASDPGLGALFGSYDDEPEAPGLVSRFRNLLHHHTHQRGAGRVGTFWAGLGAVRRGAFEASGGFDADRYRRPSIEDIELGSRLSAAGERIELDPALHGKHLKRWSLASMLRTDLLDRGVPWLELITERRTVPDELNLGWRNRLSALAASTATGSLLLRRPVPALAAAASLVALNRDLYRLLARRLGIGVIAAVPLHIAHLLVAALALPVAAARRAGALRDR